MVAIFNDKWLIWEDKNHIKALSSDRKLRLKIRKNKNLNLIENINTMQNWIEAIERKRDELKSA